MVVCSCICCLKHLECLTGGCLGKGSTDLMFTWKKEILFSGHDSWWWGERQSSCTTGQSRFMMLLYERKSSTGSSGTAWGSVTEKDSKIPINKCQEGRGLWHAQVRGSTGDAQLWLINSIHHVDVTPCARQSKMYAEVSWQLAARSAGTVWWRKSFSTRNLAILHHENQIN